ncbi:hypothetical protein VTP01DRAFT_2740 [Rhizomucor pusillus]|uniref:uncharacterized protein n=1 Tax=Rhizomucor pusillus TaxID=4840 RepID=UPI003744276B
MPSQPGVGDSLPSVERQLKLADTNQPLVGGNAAYLWSIYVSYLWIDQRSIMMEVHLPKASQYFTAPPSCQILHYVFFAYLYGWMTKPTQPNYQHLEPIPRIQEFQNKSYKCLARETYADRTGRHSS